MTGDKTSTRRDRALQTRRKILNAAHEEFLERGYHGATIASIARRAGVANQTVYFVFHTKAELVSAVIDDAVLGPEEPILPERSAWWTDMQAAPTARTRSSPSSAEPRPYSSGQHPCLRSCAQPPRPTMR